MVFSLGRRRMPLSEEIVLNKGVEKKKELTVAEKDFIMLPGFFREHIF
jgi:hypothetical protein